MNKKNVAKMTKYVLHRMPIGSEFSSLKLIVMVRNQIFKKYRISSHTLDGTIITYMRKIRKNGKRLFICTDKSKSIYKKVDDDKHYHISQNRFS